MNRHRYEPVAQREQHPIILSPIPSRSTTSNSNSQSYNFNTGLPTSTAPSSIAPSIPNSPPPSFHSHSSPGTPRPLPSQELWGVAPSTIGTETTLGTSNDALATIAGLKQRVEWLEESIGRLLLEKERNGNNDGSNETAEMDRGHRDNCCVTFTDASPDLERAVASRNRNNCCVTFKSGGEKTLERERQLRRMIVGCFCFFVAVVGITIIASSQRGHGKNFTVNGEENRLVIKSVS